MMGNCTRLCSVALGISFGLVVGLSMMLLAWAGFHWNYATSIIDMYATVFPGYEATVKGGFVGLGWGFLEGFIFGVLLAWFYNFCFKCCKACCPSGKCD